MSSKSVKDYLNNPGSKDILVLGLSPVTRINTSKNATFNRLKRWLDHVDIEAFDFHNIIPDVPGSTLWSDIDWVELQLVTQKRKLVIALGDLAGRACKKLGVPFIQLPHPSSRNRKFNDPDYENRMLVILKKELKKWPFLHSPLKSPSASSLVIHD